MTYKLRPHQYAHNKDRICGFNSCNRPSYCQGVCKLHYRRWRTQNLRLWNWVIIGKPGKCWYWRGKNRSDGRPCIMWRDIETRQPKKIHAMRAMLLTSEGPLFYTDLDAAHTCHNDQCVNPEHGVWATRSENLRMGNKHRAV